MNARQTSALLGFLLIGGSLILQFVISMSSYLANGLSVPTALVTFFSYYTILSNLALVLIFLAVLTPGRWLNWFRTDRTRGMMAGIMALVMIFYHLLLSGIWAPAGLFKLADVLLHYVAPTYYILWWLLFGRTGTLKFSDLPIMLVPTFVYLVYALVRGAIVTEYPYPVLEVHKLGYGQVFINSFMVAVGLAVLFAIAIAADRFLPRKKV